MSESSNNPRERANAHVTGPDALDGDRLQPRRAPRQERARATVQAIKEAAGQLLVERGYARVSTNLIARRAGVSVGSLYQYFPGKEAVFAALVQDHREEMKRRTEMAIATLADLRLPFAEATRRIMEQMAAVRNDTDEELLQVIAVELHHVAPDQGLKSHREAAPGADEIAAILEARPDCRPLNAHAAALAIVGCCAAVAKWLIHQAPSGTDPRPYLDQAVLVCVAAAGSSDPSVST